MKSKIFAILFLGIGLLTFSFSNNSNYTPFEPIVSNDDPDDCLDNLEIPTLFTPNADSLNQYYTVDFPCKPQSFEVQIFNRFDEEVFMTKNYIFQWDGNDKKDIPCESGIYKWKIKYMFQMTYVERKGELLLLR